MKGVCDTRPDIERPNSPNVVVRHRGGASLAVVFILCFRCTRSRWPVRVTLRVAWTLTEYPSPINSASSRSRPLYGVRLINGLAVSGNPIRIVSPRPLKGVRTLRPRAPGTTPPPTPRRMGWPARRLGDRDAHDSHDRPWRTISSASRTG